MTPVEKYESITNRPLAGLPVPLQHGFALWYLTGIEPGPFLTAVIRGDLYEAVLRADRENLDLLPQIVRWMWNNAPEDCIRSQAPGWKEQGGYLGPKEHTE